MSYPVHIGQLRLALAAAREGHFVDRWLESYMASPGFVNKEVSLKAGQKIWCGASGIVVGTTKCIVWTSSISS
ncbi:hypothetical protein ACLOJK_026764 [Asimina triloba]